ncbi:hypothetical protein PC129_g15342 [Phytophthora cactorum]|uniref:Uncharacterized protein n=1 Tax=Phytophthora cactorum TaxID=29920 RepID=A0A329S912_9STRA|nr:hypothetical protein Pcac1_g10011 [Phytophthora cactorum]KAG2822281.1 hypothetical protein PC112_g11005 [Phytophthora cactorum]KAG2824818.1 hypothetical protein PC111_g9649 [Phytophthora cactorum]KAG2856474.1 hypothetical protein PC113_g11533 [Phytophthora cactorum]KAG2904098.1 hypothetical protein PC114_g11986 [Phytophthora cactorum]
MFSLDVVRWRKSRSEQEAARLKHAEKNAASPSRAVQERQTKHLYGKSMKEMHNSYLDRVGDWVREAPTQEWGKDYAKEDYSKAYMPRVRKKELEHGGAVKNGSYSPRAVYKGGGKYVRRAESSHDEVEMPREKYAERIVNFEKTREKHKEIHPPMAFLKNKPLSCAKYFVEDIMCADNNAQSEHDIERCDASQGSKRRTTCAADCPPSPERVNQAEEEDSSEDEDGSARRRRKSAVYDRLYWNVHGSRATVLGGTATPEPPTTAEYVALPKWRQHSPEKWVGGRPFTSTIMSSNAHTASRSSISGARYSRALLLEDPFAPAGITSSPTTPEVRASEHSRRVKMAAEATFKPVQRPNKKYFNSMWTRSTEGRTHVFFDATADTSSDARRSTAESPFQASSLPSPTRKTNVGRELFQQIRLQHQQPPSVSKKQLKSN